MGRLRLSAPQMAVSSVITPVLPTFRTRHPRVEVDVVVEDRFVDLVAEGYDAGVRLSESIERDMVHVRLTEAFRFVVVDASAVTGPGVAQAPEVTGALPPSASWCRVCVECACRAGKNRRA